MNAAMVDAIAKAVLYEGYMLYPYRPSSVKNRQRFNFGVVYPRVYSDAQTRHGRVDDADRMPGAGKRSNAMPGARAISALVARSIAKLRTPVTELSSVTDANLELVERFENGGKTFQSWQEAVEETIEVTEFNLAVLDGAADAVAFPVVFPARTRGDPR